MELPDNPQPIDTSVNTNVDTLLQHWLEEAALLRQSINAASTRTKREYYTKKFRKLSKQIISLLSTKELSRQLAAMEQKADSDVAADTK